MPLSIGNWHVCREQVPKCSRSIFNQFIRVSNNYAHACDGDSPYVCSGFYRFVLSIDFLLVKANSCQGKQLPQPIGGARGNPICRQAVGQGCINNEVG